jgi:hypothetical protein
MRHTRARLIAWIALTAFLAADGTAIAHPCLAQSPRCAEEESCSHCCARHRHEAAIEVDQADADADHPTAGSHLPCPCGSHESPHPSCPCPGGCAFCNIAKVPLNASTVPSPEPIACVGACLGDGPLVYLPPFHGKLIRPPRI